MGKPDERGSTPHMRCLGCGYILDGLPENRCPECGRGFDPEDPKTYAASSRSGYRYLALAMGSAVAVVTPLVIAELADRGLVRPGRFAVLGSALMVGGVAAAVFVLDTAIRALHGPFGTLRNRPAMLAALVIGLLVVLFFVGALLLGAR